MSSKEIPWQERTEENANLLECTCEVCQQIVRAKTLPLLELAYRLHNRDHDLEKEHAANRIKLVKNGNGWILTKTTVSNLP